MWRADDRRRESFLLANRAQSLNDGSVGNMPAVPSEEKIHPMNGGRSDVRGIRLRFGRNQAAGQQGTGQAFRLSWERQDLTFVQSAHSVGNCCRVASLRLFHHENGNEKIIPLPAFVPPVTSCLLLSGNQH